MEQRFRQLVRGIDQCENYEDGTNRKDCKDRSVARLPYSIRVRFAPPDDRQAAAAEHAGNQGEPSVLRVAHRDRDGAVNQRAADRAYETATHLPAGERPEGADRAARSEPSRVVGADD